MGRHSILRELYDYLVTRKKWWLVTIILTLLLLGGVILLDQSTWVAPVLYPLF